VQLKPFITPSHCFSFNGKEKDDEVKGDGNSLDFGARIYDSRLGRWLTIDYLFAKYPSFSPYNFVLNNPILFIDPDGNDVDISNLKVPSHKAALSNFVATVEGYKYVSQFARKGDKIGGKVFSSDGNKVNDLLQINSAQLGSSAMGSTVTFLRDSEQGNTPLGVVSSQDVSSNANYVFQINLDNDISAENATYTIGHEAFVHADQDAIAIESANEELKKTGDFSKHEKSINDRGNSEHRDHAKLSKGLIGKLGNYVKQLDKIFGGEKYSKKYQQDIKNKGKI
jgi:RHS repeat-associated protein